MLRSRFALGFASVLFQTAAGVARRPAEPRDASAHRVTVRRPRPRVVEGSAASAAAARRPAERFRAVPVGLLFVGLTMAATWPQPWHLTTHAADHFDSFFSMWRIAWIAHALATPGTPLFQANIFFPQANALALSDPVLLEGLAAAPLIWSGATPLVAYNLLVLGSFVLCGVAAAALGHALTRSHAAAVLAGLVFAFAPYRFEHFFHLEILWSFWMPLAFLALHRAVRRARVRDGLVTGLLLAGQALSCLYYGVYLGAALVVAALGLVRWRERPVRTLAVLGAGALVAIAATYVYVRPLLAIAGDVPARLPAESARYSATWGSYLSTPSSNRLYGWTSALGGPELRLFPGLAALALGIAGAWRRDRVSFVYVAVLAFAFLASLGSNAPVFGSLREYLDPYGMLRVPARFAAVFLCALSALVALGAARLFAAAGSPRRRAALAALGAAIMLAEYASRPALQAVPLEPTAAYGWLQQQPPGPVVEFPLPRVRSLPGDDPRRQYFSTMHWHPLLNGYSGYYPESYLRLLVRLQVFPRGRWIDHVLDRGARYIFVHEDGLSRERLVTALERLEAHPRVRRVGRFPKGGGGTWVYVKGVN